MHQMDDDGPRFFAPPNADPIDPNYDPIIWREAALLGASMTLELERDQRAGVASQQPVRLLLAGLRGLRAARPQHGLSADRGRRRQGRQHHSPETTSRCRAARSMRRIPGPAARGRLRDIVDYDLSAMHGLLRGAAAYRGELVQNFYDMGRRAVDAGQRGAPFAFVIPPEQHDVLAVRKLEELLARSAASKSSARSSRFAPTATAYPAGSELILLSQPYRAYVKTLLERQDYPAPARRRPAAVRRHGLDAAGADGRGRADDRAAVRAAG